MQNEKYLLYINNIVEVLISSIFTKWKISSFAIYNVYTWPRISSSILIRMVKLFGVSLIVGSSVWRITNNKRHWKSYYMPHKHCEWSWTQGLLMHRFKYFASVFINFKLCYMMVWILMSWYWVSGSTFHLQGCLLRKRFFWESC